MQLPPLTFEDVALLFAIGAIVLHITVELSSARYGLTNLDVDKKRLRNASRITIVLFSVATIVKIVELFIAPLYGGVV